MLEVDALTVEDVCQMLGLSRNTVYKLAKDGSLPSFKVGRKLRFSRSEMESVLAARSAASGPTASSKGVRDGEAVALQQVIDHARASAATPFVFAGEDAVSGHLAQYLGAYGYEPVILRMNSYAALASLYVGQVDAAVVSLYDFKTNSYNVPFVQRLCPGTSLAVVRLYRRRQGMFVRAGNPQKISTWLALTQGDVRLAIREKGCGLRVLFNQKMLGMEANIEEVESRAVECSSNALALARVAQGTSDVCLGYREETLLAKGVQFVPQQIDAFDLVVRHTDKTHKALRALRQIVSSAAFKSELSSMMSCDVDACGSLLYQC